MQRNRENFKKDYEVRIAEYTKLIEKMQALAEQKRIRQSVDVALRLGDYRKCAGLKPETFAAQVDKVIIQHDGDIEFFFGNEMK